MIPYASLTQIFNVSGDSFAYCAKSNRIFKISSVMADVLEFYYSKTKEEIVSLLSGSYESSDVEDAFLRLSHLTTTYGFLDPKPLNRRLGFVTNDECEELLSKDIYGICLEVTEGCNFRCRYCTYSGGYPANRLHGSKNMGWNIAKSAIDFYHRQNKEAVDIRPGIGFYGGEPLLNFELIKQSVDYAKDLVWRHPLGIHWNITTNGSLLTEEIINYLVENSFGITISIDGPAFEHNKNRLFASGKPTFKQVLKKISLLYKIAPRNYYRSHVLVNCVFSPDTDLLAVNEFFVKNHELFFNVMTSSVRSGHETFFLEHPVNPDQRKFQIDTLFRHYVEAHICSESFDPENSNNIFTRALFERDFVKLHKRELFNNALDQVEVSPACFPGKRKLFVDVEGNLHICERVNRTYPIGDVFNGYDTNRVTSIVNDYSRVMNSEQCRSCWAFRFCGLCYSPLLEDSGIADVSDGKVCSAIKNNALSSMKSYCFILKQNAHAFDYMENYTMI